MEIIKEKYLKLKEKYLKLLDVTILLLEERIQKKETIEQLLKEAEFEKELINSEIYSI